MNEHKDDPELNKLIEPLRPTPERDPEAVARGRARFMAEVESVFEPAPALPFWRRWWNRMTLQQSKERTNMATHRQKFVFSSALALIAILVVLLGGASATALAAQSALPGEALYPVKTGLEQTRVNLSRNAADQAELHLSFAQRRLDEIASLIEQGRYEEIQMAATEFETQVQQAIDALQTVSAGDPLRARQLAGQIAESLSRYASTLGGMLASVPEPVRPAVEQAIQAASGEIEFSGMIEAMDGQNWTVAGVAFLVDSQTEIKGNFSLGDLVKVHAAPGSDGALIAREIEPAAAVGDNPNANENENGNLNDNEAGDDHGNENGNLNENEAGDDHGNDNGNLNDNEAGDDHGNDNDNEAGDDHSNDNDSSQGGETRFVGLVQSMSGDAWVVSGIAMSVTPQTDLRGAIQVGDRVEVRAVSGPDGSLIAVRLEIDSSGSLSGGADDNSNSGSGSGGGADDNSNANLNANSDDGNGNTNLNSNEDGGNTGGSTGGNTNDQSGSGSGNTNDDHSGGGSGSGSGGGAGGGNNNQDDHGGSGGGGNANDGDGHG